MSSSWDCLNKLESAFNLYRGAVGASLSLTVLSLVACLICLRAHLRQYPRLGAKIYISIGSIKILLGILLLTVFHPECPDGCSCAANMHNPASYFYGILVLLIGTLWILRGIKFLQVARDNAEEGGPEVSTNSPAAEMT